MALYRRGFFTSDQRWLWGCKAACMQSRMSKELTTNRISSFRSPLRMKLDLGTITATVARSLSKVFRLHSQSNLHNFIIDPLSIGKKASCPTRMNHDNNLIMLCLLFLQNQPYYSTEYSKTQLHKLAKPLRIQPTSLPQRLRTAPSLPQRRKIFALARYEMGLH